MGEWLLQLEDRPDAVQDIFEQSLSSLISRHFEPKQADRIFDQQVKGGRKERRKKMYAIDKRLKGSKRK